MTEDTNEANDKITDGQLVELHRIHETLRAVLRNTSQELTRCASRRWGRRDAVLKAVRILEYAHAGLLSELGSVLDPMTCSSPREFQGWERLRDSDIWAYEDPRDQLRGTGAWTLHPRAGHGYQLAPPEGVETCIRPEHGHRVRFTYKNPLDAVLQARAEVMHFRLCQESSIPVDTFFRDPYEPPHIEWKDMGNGEYDFQYQGVLWTLCRSSPGFWLHSMVLPEEGGRNAMYAEDNSLHARHKAQVVITEFYRDRDRD